MMKELTAVGEIDINTTDHDEEKAKKLIRMAKRRRSSAAAHPSTLSSTKSPVPKRKHREKPSIQISTTKQGNVQKFSSLREVALYSLQVSDNCPNFIKIKNRSAVKSVVLLVIPGLDAYSTFGLEEGAGPQLIQKEKISPDLGFIKEQFTELLPLSAPGNRDSLYPLLRTLAVRPFTKAEKTKITNELKEMKLVLPDLKMTYEDFVSNGYPIHPHSLEHESQAEDQKDGWVDTMEFEHEGSHTFALDCEMCETASGKVLTRVSMIDFDENVIFDEYVKPREEITDYLTRYSGITEEILSGITNTLEDVQQKILTTVSASDFLIGHSLENDLKVMKIRHPNIVDTSLVFEHPRGPPFKSSLKYLTKQYLQRTIQEGEHDSVEDAKACLDLVKLKLLEGALLGKVIDGQQIFDDLEKAQKRAVVIDTSRVQYNQDKYIQCTGQDDVTATVIDKVRDHDLVIARLSPFEDGLPALNTRLQDIYNSLPTNTELIIASGNGDQTEIRRLSAEKRNSPATWDTDSEEKLREATKQARMGVGFFKIV